MLLTILSRAVAADDAAITRRTTNGITLRVRLDHAEARVFAQRCKQRTCADEVELRAPDDVAPFWEHARVRVISLTSGADVIAIEAPRSDGSRWMHLLVPSPDSAAPLRSLWQGWTGARVGEEGERHRTTLVEQSEHGRVRLLLRTDREDVSICGREAFVSVRALDSSRMEFVPVETHNLAGAPATEVAARRGSMGSTDNPPFQLLQTIAASSALHHDLHAIADGNTSTHWAEAKPGPGSGEFVTFSTPRDVGLTGLDFVVRGTGASVQGASPRTFLIAVEGDLFRVRMPDNAWNREDQHYEVSFPKEIHSSCLSLVLESAFDARPDVEVAFAEVRARTSLDQKTVRELAAALSDPEPQASAAEALLLRSDPKAREGVRASYAMHTPEGRAHANNIIDAAPCSENAAFWATLAWPENASGRVDLTQSEHATERLRRCGKDAALALRAVLADANSRVRGNVALELARADPA